MVLGSAGHRRPVADDPRRTAPSAGRRARLGGPLHHQCLLVQQLHQFCQSRCHHRQGHDRHLQRHPAHPRAPVCGGATAECGGGHTVARLVVFFRGVGESRDSGQQPAFLQKRFFRCRAFAAQDLVSVGKSPKAANHVHVKEGIKVALLIPVLPKAVNGNGLGLHVFRMFKGEKEKLPRRGGVSQIIPPGQGPSGHRKGLAVRRKGAGRLPEHVAGKLIQQNQQRHGAMGGCLPMVQPSRGSMVVHGHEPIRHLSVKGVIGAEPSLRAGLPPEKEDVHRLLLPTGHRPVPVVPQCNDRNLAQGADGFPLSREWGCSAPGVAFRGFPVDRSTWLTSGLEPAPADGLPAVQLGNVHGDGPIRAENLYRYRFETRPPDRYLVHGGEVLFKSRGEPTTAAADSPTPFQRDLCT